MPQNGAENAVVTAIERLTQQLKDAAKNKKEQQDSEKRSESFKKLNAGLVNLTQSITGLNFSYTGVIDVTKKSLDSADKLQQSFLGVGSNLTKEFAKSAQAINDLGVGSIIPLQERLKFVQEGFTNVTDSNLKVATELSITGQSTASMRSVLKAALIQGGQAREQGDMFISTMVKTAKSRGVQAELVAKSMQALAKTMEVPDFMGVGNNLREAMVQLTSEYSIGEKSLSRFITAFISSDNLTSRVITGTQHLAAIIGSNTASVSEVKEGILRAASMVDNTSSSFEKRIKVAAIPFTSAGTAMGIFGQELVMGARGLTNAQKLGINAIKKSDDFRESMFAQRKRLEGHLEKLTINLLPKLIEHFPKVAGVGAVSQVGANVAGGVAGSLAAGAGARGFLLGAGKFLLRSIPVVAAATMVSEILGYTNITGLNSKTEDNTKGIKSGVDELVRLEKDKIKTPIASSSPFAKHLARRANIQSALRSSTVNNISNQPGNNKLAEERVQEILKDIFIELRNANRINKKKK